MELIRVVGSEPAMPSWIDRMTGDGWYHWRRLESFLRSSPRWTGSQVDSLSAESIRVLKRMPDPRQSGPFQGRGLVVGYVQSGKTANYTAVAARAVDAGYRIVIILSGIHDSLRNQTQNRLERELTGHQGGFERAEVGREWVCLTTPVNDFETQDPRILQSTAPFLMVAKKHVKVLAKIDSWLASASRFLPDMPVLIIDDEADQASINTRGNRRLDPAITEDEEDDSDHSPSRTNALIRSILSKAPRASYIAYTATPFANILINPNAVDRKVGEDLFPKDFVLQLPRPGGYTGTEELFGVRAQGREVRKAVSEEDVRILRAPARRRPGEVVLASQSRELPESLSDAVLAFCLAGGVRSYRGDLRGKPHTMLVHVSQRTSDQERIAEAIRRQLELWRAALSQGQSLHPIFSGVWEEMRRGVASPPKDDDVINASIAVMKELVVLELNSAKGEDLEYDEKPGRHVIAVGGNRLSRGLTLEGLTITYFLRTAAMCDTLLQMARWYGFRQGYEDLIRIWTTDGIARWFAELALVEQSMRDSIVALERAGRRPNQMAIRLRAHSELLLTARNKGTMGSTVRDSWSGDHPQTILLPLAEPSKLQFNRELTDRFLTGLRVNEEQHGGLVVRDVAADAIHKFLRDYRIHDDIVAFRNDLLADWIMSRVAAGELDDWTVFVASPKAGRTVSLGGHSVGLVRRSLISSESIGILIDPRHEGVDLPNGPEAYKRDGGTYDSDAMRAARPSTQGLLIIYPLDAAGLNVDSTDTVIALALSLPRTSDAGTAWVVNRGLRDD